MNSQNLSKFTFIFNDINTAPKGDMNLHILSFLFTEKHETSKQDLHLAYARYRKFLNTPRHKIHLMKYQNLNERSEFNSY